MNVAFSGKWRGTVVGRNAGFGQRVLVSGATTGNGAYNGVVGNSFVFADGQVELQWNDNADSGWQPSAIISSVGMTSPLVVVRFIAADDGAPGHRDGDYDDLEVRFEHLDPVFEVVQRPFALERGSLTMLPDGIFDTSQGVQYMGVRVRNTWFFDWQSGQFATGMKIGISHAARAALAAQGITVLDTWSAREMQAFGQVMDGAYVRVPALKIGEETTVYFKLDVSAASPSKPEIGFVAQRDAYDPAFDAPTRVEHKRIFVSRSSYDKTTKEIVAALPEGTLRMKLKAITLDLKAANDAAKELMSCQDRHGGRPGSWWEDEGCGGEADLERWNETLRKALRELLAGKDIDICALRDAFDRCCAKDPDRDDCCKRDHGEGGGFPGAGWQDGTGMDGWCRVKPVAWLPLAFDYRIEPNPAYTGQYGPLAFEDPWWKVILLIAAILLALASLVYDYVEAGQDPRFIIGKITRNGDAMANSIDCAVATLNGSRGIDLGALDAQTDDVNNDLPIDGLDTIIQMDRSDNGNFGVQDAVLGNVVWKSGGRSGTTRGIIDSIHSAFSITYDTEDTISGTVSFTDQVIVTQIAAMEQVLSQHGDSGSLWVDMATRRPVALNFAGPTDDSGDSASANPIRAVVDQLDIRFNT